VAPTALDWTKPDGAIAEARGAPESAMAAEPASGPVGLSEDALNRCDGVPTGDFVGTPD
jgi:hypothetical protein